ncbi:MAG: SDR family NAD(P)-dependent oxidoreductase, partial [Alphaproteobacteria bacterium]|nr:SDR family NAD(P)-dependent oxidoreductase [Alphaproteobacteria bacterium]
MRDPRHILVTGASSGLGAALALAYAAPGVTLALHGRDAARLERVAAQARARGAEIHAHIGDVTDKPGMAAWVAACDARKPLDLVIANAGISGGTSGGGESAAQAERIFAVNVGGVLNTVRPALASMTKRNRGQVAVMSSLASFRGFPGAPAYCASKAAVRIYGEALRGAAARDGIEVNVICPGFVKTPLTDVNPFPMPCLMSAERAAHIVRQGLARNRARIAFPWRMSMLIRLFAALPQPL